MSPAKKKKAKRAWQDVAQEAQKLRDESLLELHCDATIQLKDTSKGAMGIAEQVLGPEDIALTTLSLEEVTHLTSSGAVPARHVILAFLRRATLAQQLTNCITELLPKRALSRAETLDRQVQDNANSPNPKVPGPLHGIPLSVKSHIGIAGTHMPAGYVAWWDRIAPHDALVVQILERAGAVTHARTTEPQSMMHLECASNLYGETVNPYNTGLSSGGSSGGEGALIAQRGSLLGVGSDVGGSIRVPAAACGIYGLKPTGFRVPTTGWGSTPPGADPIPTVLGPMSSSLSGIDLFMRVVLAAEPWKQEPALVPLPWRDLDIRPSNNRPLRLGVIWHDGVVLPHPPITRALREFTEKAGSVPNVEITNFLPYKHDEAWAIVSSLYYTDGGEADLSVMAESGEPSLPLTEWMIKHNAAVKSLDRVELEYWLEEREEFRLEYAKEWDKTGIWNEEQGAWEGTLDALICPVSPGVTTKPGTAKYWSYTAVWNLLDYPAMAFPAGVVDRKEDTKAKRMRFMSGLDKDNWNLYDPKTFDTMPVSLQIVGRRFDDEKIIGILKYLEEVIPK